MRTASNDSSKLINAFLGFGLLVLVTWVLSVGRHILVPAAVAVFLWFLINALANVLVRYRVPRGVAVGLSCVTFVGGLVLVLELIAYNIANMVTSIPTSGAEFQKMLEGIVSRFGLKDLPSVGDFSAVADFGVGALASIAEGLQATAGVVVTIVLYIVFLLAEQHGFGKKLHGYLGNEPGKIARAERAIKQIATRVQAYLWNKTLVSIVVGVVSYIVMKIAGLDYAEFWAIVIFLFNYIPFVGAMIATVLPAIFGLIQFPTVTPVILMVVGLIAGHFVIGNVVEPRIQGKSLNLSPLVILVSMAFWGSLWDVVGMLLCVPITASIMVMAAQSPATRRFAVLLSESGDVDDLAAHDDVQEKTAPPQAAHA